MTEQSGASPNKLKRGKAATKFARENKMKHPSAKVRKSKVRRVTTKPVTDPRSQLEAMPLVERIAAVAADVHSKRDKYRSIESHELALLLGIGNAYRPGGDWKFVWYIPHVPIEDVCEMSESEYVLELLQPNITVQRYEELNSRFAVVDKSKLGHGRLMSDLLTKVEKQTIERLYMENQDKADDAQCLAFHTVSTLHDKTLAFEALIEDDGGCVDLKTPYDERDGAFRELSDCLIVEDRRCDK